MLLTLGVLSCGTLLAAAFLAVAAMEEYRRDRVPTLLYHRFLGGAEFSRARAEGENLSYVTEAGAFAAQMDYLASAGYTTIALGEFLASLLRGVSLPPRPIIITCDDGFESFYRHAYPVLKRLGMRATVFMTADRASENFARYARFDGPLTDAQLVEMSRNGIAIESHGMTHRYLSDLPEREARWELEEARARLERATGLPVRFFSVPSGAYNRKVRRLAREAGYEGVYCMKHGSNSRASDRFALRRLTVARDFGLEDFQRLLTPAAACELRMVNALHNGLRITLGSRRLDALHDFLSRTEVRAWLRPERLRYVFLAGAGIAAAILATIALVVLGGR